VIPKCFDFEVIALRTRNRDRILALVRSHGDFKTYRDFVSEDINAGEASAYMLFAEGLDELPIRDVFLRNVIVKYAREPLFLRNVDGIRLDNVRVKGTTLPEFSPMTPSDAPRLKISI
jgi:hypothetical protein